jgi:hypothetical protein
MLLFSNGLLKYITRFIQILGITNLFVRQQYLKPTSHSRILIALPPERDTYGLLSKSNFFVPNRFPEGT